MLTYLKIIRELQIGIIEQKKLGNANAVKTMEALRDELKKKAKQFEEYLKKSKKADLIEFLQHYYYEAKSIKSFDKVTPDTLRTTCSRCCRKYDFIR